MPALSLVFCKFYLPHLLSPHREILTHQLTHSGSYISETTGGNYSDVFTAIDTVKNFLNYVQHHDVCPEYEDDLKKAIDICKRAQDELDNIATAGQDFPGDFNRACRVLFCSSSVTHSPDDFYSDHQLYEDKKAHELSPGEMVTAPGAVPSCIVVPTDFNRQMVFETTIALHRPDLIPLLITNTTTANRPRVTHTYDETYEVTALHPADAALIDVYAGITQHDLTLRAVSPVGHAVLTPSIIEDGWDNHPTLAEGRRGGPGKPVTVFLEHAVMAQLGVGVKLRATMCHLEFLGGGGGASATLEFVKEVSEVVPAWHVYLPQQLMVQYKAPRPDTRPPPSAMDPGVEQRRLEAISAEEEREEIKELRKVDLELDREMRELEDVEALQKLMARTEI